MSYDKKYTILKIVNEETILPFKLQGNNVTGRAKARPKQILSRKKIEICCMIYLCSTSGHNG
jgi:hypothetical protein